MYNWSKTNLYQFLWNIYRVCKVLTLYSQVLETWDITSISEFISGFIYTIFTNNSFHLDIKLTFGNLYKYGNIV